MSSQRTHTFATPLVVVVMAAATLAALLLTTSARAATTSTQFAPSVTTQGTALHLNGAGTRYRSTLAVYDMALYAPHKADSADALIALPGPKRLMFVALRELMTGELGRLFVQGITENSSREQLQRHVLPMSKLADVFSSRTKILVGEPFAIEFVPGKGALFTVDGKLQGEPIGDAEFFAMILRVWLGPVPVDRALKDALLGVATAVSSPR